MKNKSWDNKFGLLELTYSESEDNYSQRMKEQAIYNATPGAIVEGLGKDVPIISNSLGGKQSSSPYAPHLIDPDFLDAMVSEEGPLHYIALYMKDPSISTHLFLALEYRQPDEPKEEIDYNSLMAKRLLTISKVLKEGADKYETNNWRLIPAEQHLSHAISHYLAYLLDDKQDDHLDHFYTRLMMAYATEESEDFSYTTYIKKS